MKLKKIITGLSLVFTLTSLLFAPLVLAQGLTGDTEAELTNQNEAFLNEAGLGTQTSISVVVSGIIRILLSFLFLCCSFEFWF